MKKCSNNNTAFEKNVWIKAPYSNKMLINTLLEQNVGAMETHLRGATRQEQEFELVLAMSRPK